MTENEIAAYFRDRYPKRLIGKTVGLIGELGAGKTYLVRTILTRCSAEFSFQVDSPTYSFCNIYAADRMEVHHFDLYRIKLEEELYDIGVLESMGNSELLTFVEWIDLFPDLEERCDLVVTIAGENAMREYCMFAKMNSLFHGNDNGVE